MNTEIKNYLTMDKKERHVYFIDRIIDSEEVWGLFENGKMLSVGTQNGKDIIPVWSTKKFAEHSAKGFLQEGAAEKIDLRYFVDNILSEAIKNKDIVAPQLDYETGNYLWDVGGNRALKIMIESNLKKKEKWLNGSGESGSIKDKFSLSNFIGANIDSVKTAKYIEKEIKRDRKKDVFFYKPPYWMEEEDPLRGYFKDIAKILNEGKVRYAYVISYKDAVFDQYPVTDLPVKVIYSMDDSYLSYPAGLTDVGDRFDNLEPRNLNDIEKEIMEYIYDQDYRPMNYLLPETLAGKNDIYLTTILIHRDHLKEKMLMRRLIPVLACPNVSDIVTLVPSKYWPDNYLKYYFSEREVSLKR